MLNVATRSLLRGPSARLAAVPRITALYQSTRTVVTLKHVKYTANATASGAGRNGHELGGAGGGSNPEQLFAMGYASCLLGAIQLQARILKKGDQGKNAVVHTSVHIGEPKHLEGFGISVDIKVEGVDDELLAAGHEFCPYSRALKHGATVNISKA
ncbi:organic hydroperoxide resistance protein [Cyathus striatus]|nr:organic hydroperoxide resistance protein [Cyathus striatus]